MRAVALLLGGGRGERLAGSVPKCFVEVAGKSLLSYSIELAEACAEVESFVVAAPAGAEERVSSIAGASPKFLAVVAGGATRQDSVGRALEAVPEGYDTIVCHDVARPFAKPALLTSVIGALAHADGAVPGLPVTDTLKRVEDSRISETLGRDGLFTVQTPQAFHRDRLEAAHAAARQSGFLGTDDAALLERAGFRISVIPGDPGNIKLTTPKDVELAALLARDLG
jgi:2-C-methyl-D-erythritol 4-phosphate cytidylyltransferase